MISDSRMQYVTNFFEETTSQAKLHARYGDLCLLKFADLFILWKPVWNPIGKRLAVEVDGQVQDPTCSFKRAASTGEALI